MQRSQHGIDNPALDAAIEAANAPGEPAAVLVAYRNPAFSQYNVVIGV